jgi:hypothetical protein
MDSLVLRHNIEAFMERLSNEHDPQRRCILQDMIIEEVDKLGTGCEHLGFIQERIDAANALIVAKRQQLKSGLSFSTDTPSIVDTLRDTKQVFEQKQRKIEEQFVRQIV